jgi:hypothetical protein
MRSKLIIAAALAGAAFAPLASYAADTATGAGGSASVTTGTGGNVQSGTSADARTDRSASASDKRDAKRNRAAENERTPATQARQDKDRSSGPAPTTKEGRDVPPGSGSGRTASGYSQ